MADYFTNFSVLVPLKEPAHQQYALDLAAKAAACRFLDNQEQVSTDVPATLLDVLEDWNFETKSDGGNSIWLHSDSGGTDAACAFIQHLLQRFHLTERVAFEWSHDCSKPRLDAYGGGAAIITAEKIISMNTSLWLQQQAATHKNP